MKKAVIFLVLFFSLLTINAQQRYELNTSKSSISYAANHKLHAWDAVNSSVKGIAVLNDDQTAINQLAVLLNVRDFDSKNSSRDAHSMEVLEAIRFPNIKFYAQSIELNGSSTTINGTLNFHGIDGKISVLTQFKKIGDELILSGKFSIKPTDYKVKLPAFMLVPIDDRLDINFELAFKTTS